MEGNGSALICSVGKNCRYQILSEHVKNDNEDSKLNKRLQKASERISFLGIASGVCSILILIGKIWLIYRSECEKYGPPSCPYNGYTALIKDIVSKLMIAVSIIVATMPEGLILSIAISNACCLKQMIESQIHVRKFEAPEILMNLHYHIHTLEKLDQ